MKFYTRMLVQPLFLSKIKIIIFEGFKGAFWGVELGFHGVETFKFTIGIDMKFLTRMMV